MNPTRKMFLGEPLVVPSWWPSSFYVPRTTFLGLPGAKASILLFILFCLNKNTTRSVARVLANQSPLTGVCAPTKIESDEGSNTRRE